MRLPGRAHSAAAATAARRSLQAQKPDQFGFWLLVSATGRLVGRLAGWYKFGNRREPANKRRARLNDLTFASRSNGRHAAAPLARSVDDSLIFAAELWACRRL